MKRFKPYAMAFPYMACLFLLSGCLGPRKVDNWVAHEYQNTPLAPEKKHADYITISSTVTPSAGDRISTTNLHTRHFLPLLFYWRWDFLNNCQLNPQIPINNFTATVIAYAGSKHLKQKLGNRRIELSIDKIPHTFAIEDDGRMVWVIYAVGWDVLDIQPGGDNLSVSYRILQGEEEIKKGTIRIPDPDKHFRLKMFQSLKKKTWEYLDLYNTNITLMSKQVVDQLITEL